MNAGFSVSDLTGHHFMRITFQRSLRFKLFIFLKMSVFLISSCRSYLFSSKLWHSHAGGFNQLVSGYNTVLGYKNIFFHDPVFFKAFIKCILCHGLESDV